MNDLTLLNIACPGLSTRTVPLEEGTSLFAGSAAHCRLSLAGDDVAPIHFMLRTDKNRTVYVQDWNTGGRTVLNGQPIDGETVLGLDDELRVGPYRIALVGSTEQNSDSNECEPSANQETESEAFEIEESWDDALEVSVSVSDEQLFDGPFAADASKPKPSGFRYQLNLDDEDWTDADQDSFEFLESDNGLADEQVGLLRSEIQYLQSELAQRDAQIEELQQSSGRDFDYPPEDDNETTRLVNRLEELLEELQSSDHRVRELEELLRLSDQATQAEQEERHQLESWVMEIEQRVTQREALAEAELSRIARRRDDVQSDFRRVQHQLKQALLAIKNSSGENSAKLISDFRDRIEELELRLSAAQAENEQLIQQKKQEEAEIRHELKTLEQSFLELQVSTSQERAQLARDREQLQRMKDQLEKKLNADHELDDANTRIRAMREHLKEVHQQEREEKSRRSLSGRIARLLNR